MFIKQRDDLMSIKQKNKKSINGSKKASAQSKSKKQISPKNIALKKKAKNNLQAKNIAKKKQLKKNKRPSNRYNHFALVQATNHHLVALTNNSPIRSELQKFTGVDRSEGVHIDRTPRGVNPSCNANGVCGHTKNGTELQLYTPMPKIEFSVDGNPREVEIFSRLGVKAKKQISPIMEALETLDRDDETSQEVTATTAQLEAQPKRKEVKRERAVVGGSAAEDVRRLGKLLGIEFTEEELKACQFEHCHKVSFKIGYGAVSAFRESYDTQIKENLGSGSRALNESMMRVENVIVLMLKKNLCKEVRYECKSQNYRDSHTLASLSLNFAVKAHNGRNITFSHTFSVQDNRALNYDIATILYAAINAAITMPLHQSIVEQEEKEKVMEPSVFSLRDLQGDEGSPRYQRSHKYSRTENDEDPSPEKRHREEDDQARNLSQVHEKSVSRCLAF